MSVGMSMATFTLIRGDVNIVTRQCPWACVLENVGAVYGSGRRCPVAMSVAMSVGCRGDVRIVSVAMSIKIPSIEGEKPMEELLASGQWVMCGLSEVVSTGMSLGMSLMSMATFTLFEAMLILLEAVSLRMYRVMSLAMSMVMSVAMSIKIPSIEGEKPMEELLALLQESELLTPLDVQFYNGSQGIISQTDEELEEVYGTYGEPLDELSDLGSTNA